jgi:hypothetical protein
MRTVDEFRDGLTEEVRQTVDLLREIIAAAHDDLSERIKWNAPSFAIGEEDLITLGLERNGGVRVVLHRGAKRKDVTDFRFDDTAGLARWPAADRGVVVFRDRSAVERRRDALSELCFRWVRCVA